MSKPDVQGVDIAWSDVGISVTFLAVNVAASIFFRLGLERSLITASLRCSGQLIVMGQVLKFIFNAEQPAWVFSIATVLALLGTWEAVYNQCKARHRFMFITTFASLSVATSIIGYLGCKFVLHFDPVWTPRLFIPTIGLMLGASITGLSLGLHTCLSEMQTHKESLEQMLAFGATRWEASRRVMRSTVKIGMLPTINSMNIMGIVSIPGSMSGQLLSGVPVDQAVRYQLCVMFMIAASATISVIVSTLVCISVCVDKRHRMRDDHVTRQLPLLYAWRNKAILAIGRSITAIFLPIKRLTSRLLARKPSPTRRLTIRRQHRRDSRRSSMAMPPSDAETSGLSRSATLDSVPEMQEANRNATTTQKA